MPLRIEVYDQVHVPEVLAFNQRLIAADGFPGFGLPDVPPPRERRTPLGLEARLVIDGGAVRGGYLLQWRDFWIRGACQPVCALQSPISEGIINRKFAGVGPTIVRSAVSVNPRVYGVGMGGADRPLPKLLRTLGFHVTTVPFLFRVNRPGRFLRHIRHLRSTWPRRIALDLARITGVGSAALRIAHLAAARPLRDTAGAEPANGLDDVADAIWHEARVHYALAAVRDAAMIRALYPTGDRFHHLCVRRRGTPIGWAVVAVTQMYGNKYFGDMNVGVIADTFSAPADAPAIVHAAAAEIARRGADITIANFQHAAWISACRQQGFFAGPSNHCLALSAQLMSDLSPGDSATLAQIHLTRGDSDGLVNL